MGSEMCIRDSVNVTDRLRFSKTGAKAYFREDGSVKRVGDRVVNPDLATTLERIAEHGPDIFYSGEIAEQIAADFASHDGLLTLADLKGYATRRIDPIAFDYRGYSLTTNHPPGGGIMVTQMLNTLEHFDLVELGHNSAEYIRVVSEAMKAATADKDAHVGDPAFHSVQSRFIKLAKATLPSDEP